MSGKKKDFEDAKAQIEANLGGLFGALGDAIGEMVTRLEDGKSGAVERNLSFDTDKGPVRAQAGVRLRMGGLDVGTTGTDSQPAPKPINPQRKRTASAPAAQPQERPLAYDLLSDEDGWTLTADVPGVDADDLKLDQVESTLRITTGGARAYRADVALDGPFDLADVTTTLRNGILTLHIPKGGGA
ncbi:MAG: Hsp20/alpha crystallin family protein [Pseudomonadota bacterium]